MSIYLRDKAMLPSAYQEVEYIQSSGTQYIDTGKTVSGDVKADYTYMPKENVTSSTAGGLLVFIDNDWRSNGFGSSNTYTYYGGNTSNNEGYTVGTLQQDVLCHDIVAKSGCSRTLNGTTVSYVPSSSYPSPTGTLKLFVSQRAGSITNYWKTRMYSFKRYDSGVLTQDLIPCYRKSDNVIGVYDLVNGQFYTNSGTGTFSKGADVLYEREVKNIYIGGVLEYTISNIPTTDTNVYVNVAKSGATIQSVKCSFTTSYVSAGQAYFSISSNNSNTNRFGLSLQLNGASTPCFIIRGRLNGATDTTFANISGVNLSGANTVVFTVNRNGNCEVICNGVTTNYTASSAALNIIQTIMNLSDMNVYGAQSKAVFNGNKVDVEVIYS